MRRERLTHSDSDLDPDSDSICMSWCIRDWKVEDCQDEL